ncbi:Kelch repeat-containing protein [Gemmatimonadota bacterium]
MPNNTATAYFRITPIDAENGWGDSSSLSFYLDNKPPEWIAASGVSGDTTITFWFDELVDETVATNTANISLSGGLTTESISGIGTDEWATKTPMPTARYNHSAVAINGKLYVAGGDADSDALSALEVYDPVTNSWTTLISMPTARSSPAAAAIGGKLYVAGGYNSGYVSTLEVYDPSTDSWTTLSSMPTARHYAATAAIDGKLYVAGGYGSNYVSTLEVYDPATDSWTTKASMPFPRYDAAAAAIGGKLYVAGGFDGDFYLNTLDVYDPTINGWTTLTSMPTARRYAIAVAIGGKLYVAGGWNGSNLSTLEVYDPATDSWTTATSMPTARRDAAAAAIDGKLYVAGGYGSSGRLSTLEVYSALPSRFDLALTSGQTLPSSESSVILTASNISDLYGNTAASLDTTFYPLSGEVPSISIDPLTGIQSGDIVVSYTIADAEQSTINLRAEYSTDSGDSWQIATITGDTSDISSANYSGSLTWQSRTDLPGQAFNEVSFRIIPRDHPTVTGDPDVVVFGLDNKPPEWIAAAGAIGDTTTTFWFDELVDETTATNTANFSLSGGLTIESIGGMGTDSWMTKASMPTARYGAVAAAIGGKLYVAGGNDGSIYVSTLEVYDPATDSWTTATSMPTARDRVAAAAIGGKLYVAGGYNSGYLSMLEVYDPATDSWSTATSMPTARYGAVAAAINGKLYVAGGHNSSGYLSTLVVYDPVTDSWITATSMPTARYGAVAAAIGGKLYVAGERDIGSISRYGFIDKLIEPERYRRIPANPTSSNPFRWLVVQIERERRRISPTIFSIYRGDSKVGSGSVIRHIRSGLPNNR